MNIVDWLRTVQPRAGTMQDLAKAAAILASPEAKYRHSWWSVGGNRWTVLFVWRAREGSPPEYPRGALKPRINPDFLAKVGEELTGDARLHAIMRARMRAYTQDKGLLSAETAAAIAMDAYESARQQGHVP